LLSISPPSTAASPKRLSPSQRKTETCMAAPERPGHSTHEQIKAIAARLSTASKGARQGLFSARRATAPSAGPSFDQVGRHLNASQASINSIQSEPGVSRSEPYLSPLVQRDPIVRPESARRPSLRKVPNLDYMAFSHTQVGSPSSGQLILNRGHLLMPMKADPHGGPTEWERLLGSLDNGQTNIYDNIYGGPPVEALADMVSLPSDVHWPADAWGLEHIDISSASQYPVPRSVLSLSDESLTSGEEWTSVHGGGALDTNYPALGMPSRGLESLDGGFGL
jgi:hypothetical protein